MIRLWWLMALVLIPLRVDAGRVDLEQVVNDLCQSQWEGRGLGSPGLEAAADYLESEMIERGLVGAFEGAIRQTAQTPSGESFTNLAGWIGNGSPQDGWVLVCAHYDGQGRDGYRVLPGADDNASGVAALLAAAELLTDLGVDRPVAFVAFSAEESGLLGSRHFVDHPPAPLSALRAVVNLDTVGRVVDEELTVFGASSGAEFESILNGVNLGYGFDLKLVARGVNASDDQPFRERGVPAVHVFSVAHGDYHRPTDTPDKLNYEALERVAGLTADFVEYLARETTQITFVPPGAASAPPTTSQGRRRVSFGSIPDFERTEGGVLLTGVIEGSPAAAAGLRAGDVLVEFGDVAIDNLQEYSDVLKQYDPGDEVVVRFERDGEAHEVTVTLVARH